MQYIAHINDQEFNLRHATEKRECGESTQVQGKKQMTVLVF